MAYLSAAAGLAILLLGAELLLRGATSLAERLGMSTLMIGLTVVAFGTSMPELTVSVQAVASGSPGITTGNVIGSNIANILLILGVGAMLWPLRCIRRSVARDGTSLLFATALFTAFVLTGSVAAVEGLMLLAALFAFLVWSYVSERQAMRELMQFEPQLHEPKPPVELRPDLMRSTTLVMSLSLGFIGAGIAGLYFGADLLIDGAVAIARQFQLSEEVIGLTLIALGTSLPELAAVFSAARRKQSDIVVGNVIGSNIFNCLAIMGTAALVGPIEVAPEVIRIDLWVMLLATLVLIPAMVTGWRISRIEAAGFLICYLGFIVFRFFGAPGAPAV